MRKLLIDIECYHNYFLLGCRDYDTKEVFYFEIGELVDDRKKLQIFLSSYKDFWISFNGMHYDNVVLTYGQKHNWWMNESSVIACRKLKMFSDIVIEDDDNYEKIKNYKYFFKFINIDLFLYWPKGLRLTKKIGLKGLGIQLGYPVVQELPFDPKMSLTTEQIDELRHYNLQHDLGILDLLTQAFEGKSKIPLGNLGTIQLRHTVVDQYGLDAWSWDAPKIASKALLSAYCKDTNQDPKVVEGFRFERPIIKFGDLFKNIDFGFTSTVFKNVYHEWMNSYDTFSTEFVINTKSEHGLKISCGIGGIHSILSNKIYEADENYKILDIDIELERLN